MESLYIFNKDNQPTQIFIHTDTTDYISACIRHEKRFYEHEFLEFIKTNYNNHNNIIDIGANIGNHSLFFVKYLNCNNIYSFEPFQKNIAIFKSNLKDHQDKCILYETALSSKNGNMTLYNSEKDNHGGYSLNKQVNSFLVDTIPTFMLDDFDFEGISLIKIDVENHEIDVLLGAKKTILKCKPIIILENSYYYFSNLFPNPEPHKEIMEELNYKKIHSNICNSAMDMWIHSSST